MIQQAGAEPAALHAQLEEELARRPKVYGGNAQPGLSPQLQRVLQDALGEASGMHDDYVSTEHLLLALLGRDGAGAAKLLARAGITRDRVLAALTAIRGSQRVTSQTPETTYKALEKYGRDLTQMARAGKLDPVGRRRGAPVPRERAALARGPRPGGTLPASTRSCSVTCCGGSRMPALRFGSTERRYVLYQLPGALLAAALLAVLWSAAGLPAWAAFVLFVVWVVKDAVLFPFLRRAYERTPGGASVLVGSEAVVVAALAPRGRVRIGTETWRAETEDASGPIPEGARVVVTAARGLTLIVRPRAPGGA